MLNRQKSIVSLTYSNEKCLICNDTKKIIKYLGTKFTKIVQIFVKKYVCIWKYKITKYMKRCIPEWEDSRFWKFWKRRELGENLLYETANMLQSYNDYKCDMAG